MRGSGLLWRAMDDARRAGMIERGEGVPGTAPSGIARRSLLKAIGAAAIAGGMRPALALPARPTGRVAILGGGIAGLSALHHLRAAGVDARLYEARKRLGGRMHTRRPAGGPAFERGAQLVNSDHDDMHALARDYGIALIDRKAEPHETLILADGRLVPPAALANALRPIAAQIDADAAALDADYARVAPRFDALSITAYLDRHAGLIGPSWVRRLMEATARTEYGVEPGEASALELLFNLPVVDGQRVEVLGHADERYVIDGGSSALAAAIGARHADRIETGREAIRIETRPDGRQRVTFLDLSSIDADQLIVALPLPLMRMIELAVPVAPDWRRFFTTVRLGDNEKYQIATGGRPWQAAMGVGGEVWNTDHGAPSPLAWDGSVHDGGTCDPVWTWFLGGEGAREAVANARGPGHYFPTTAPVFPPAGTHAIDRTGWGRDPLTRGGYINFRPGELTRFGHLMWVEGEAPVAHGNGVWFVGEHLSDAYPGYMNGAAQTGRMAAAMLTGGGALRRAA